MASIFHWRARIIMARAAVRTPATCLRDTLRHEIGQLLMAGFDGHQCPSSCASLAREFSLGGVIFFARNVEEPMQVAEVARRPRR